MLKGGNPSYTFFVDETSTGMRLDVFLSQQDLPFSRSQMQRRIDEGEVTVDHKKTKAGHKLKPLQRIDFEPAPIRYTHDLPEEISLDILYEDSHLIVVNKPAGMVVHPAPGHRQGTLVNALLFHCGPLPFPSYPSATAMPDQDEEEFATETLKNLAIGGEHRPGIVHRLDQGTSGVLVCAKDETTLRGLQKQFQDHSIRREYLAIVQGVLPQQGTFQTRYGRHPHDRKKFTSRSGGKHAITHYTVLERFAGASYIRIRLETGRTHQIRVHFSEAGHPIVGDPLYGTQHRKGNMPVLKQIHETLCHQALHATVLGFVHPRLGTFLEFSVPPPSDMEWALSQLRSALYSHGEKS